MAWQPNGIPAFNKAYVALHNDSAEKQDLSSSLSTILQLTVEMQLQTLDEYHNFMQDTIDAIRTESDIIFVCKLLILIFTHLGIRPNKTELDTLKKNIREFGHVNPDIIANLRSLANILYPDGKSTLHNWVDDLQTKSFASPGNELDLSSAHDISASFAQSILGPTSLEASYSAVPPASSSLAASYSAVPPAPLLLPAEPMPIQEEAPPRASSQSSSRASSRASSQSSRASSQSSRASSQSSRASSQSSNELLSAPIPPPIPAPAPIQPPSIWSRFWYGVAEPTKNTIVNHVTKYEPYYKRSLLGVTMIGGIAYGLYRYFTPSGEPIVIQTPLTEPVPSGTPLISSKSVGSIGSIAAGATAAGLAIGAGTLLHRHKKHPPRRSKSSSPVTTRRSPVKKTTVHHPSHRSSSAIKKRTPHYIRRK
jgi:hypothetical protein